MNRAPEVILGGLSCPFVGEINNMTIKSLLESFKEPCVREGQGRLLQIPFTARVLVQSMKPSGAWLELSLSRGLCWFGASLLSVCTHPGVFEALGRGQGSRLLSS